jgi:hypothetical protein
MSWLASRSITSTFRCEYWRTSSESVGAVHGAGPQPEHHPHHAGLGVDVFAPAVRIVRQPDAGHVRIEERPVALAGDPLDQKRHLLVAFQQPPLGAVAQRLLAHRAGVDRPHGRHEVFQPLLMLPLVGAEDALVFAGEGVAEAVLQEAAGADDDRRLPEVVEHLGELAADVVGELPAEEPPAGLLDAVEKRGRVPLLLPQPPAAVLHEVRVEDVGPDEERVVGLQQAIPTRVAALEDRPGQEHPDRLPADQPRADHPPPDRQHIREREVFLGQAKHAVVAGDDHPQERLEVPFGVLRRASSLLDRLPDRFGLEEPPVPHSQARTDRVGPRPGLRGEDLGGRRTFRHRRKLVLLPDVEHVHRRRVAVLHLDRLQVELVAVAEDVEQDLGGVGDRRRGVEGVASSQEAEEGQRLDVEDVGAREEEEVAQHAVAIPVDRERGEAIEDEVGPPPRFVDGPMDLGDEVLEPGLDLQPADARPRVVGHERIVVAEAEVDELPPFLPGILAEVADEGGVVADRIDLPDDVVAGDQAAEHAVQARQSGAELGADHGEPPSSCSSRTGR